MQNNKNNSTNNRDRKENRALLIGAANNLFMAVLAWYTYYLSNSEAVFLDGNYSFIMFLGVLVAQKITTVKARKTKTFPLGQFFYESLYGFIKGLMILYFLIMAVVTAIARIYMYFTGSWDNLPILIPEPIFYYAIICAFICYSLSIFYYKQNRSIGNRSILLKTEQKVALVDGTLSMGVAAGFFFLAARGSGSENGFITYLADSFFVLILASIPIKEPLAIIRESVIELAGGTLQDQEKREAFEKAIYSNMPEGITIEDIFISKNGSKYIVLIYISTDEASYTKKDIIDTKNKIRLILSKDHPYLSVDMIPEGNPVPESSRTRE